MLQIMHMGLSPGDSVWYLRPYPFPLDRFIESWIFGSFIKRSHGPEL